MLLELFQRGKNVPKTDYFALTKADGTGADAGDEAYPYMQRFLDVAVKEEHTEAVERIAEKSWITRIGCGHTACRQITAFLHHTGILCA